MRFQNGSNKVAIKLRVVQFWSEIILVILNQTRAARSFDFKTTRMISDQIAIRSVQLPLLMIQKKGKIDGSLQGNELDVTTVTLLTSWGSTYW